MGKKEKTVNPADALRKQQRKKELKKNKEDKKKGKIAAKSQVSTAKLEIEFRKLSEQELAGTLDSNGKFRIRQIQDKIKDINEARTLLGLAPKVLTVEEPAKSKAAKSERVYKYYHPTFNPNGKRKGQGSQSGDEDRNANESGEGSESDQEDALSIDSLELDKSNNPETVPGVQPVVEDSHPDGEKLASPVSLSYIPIPEGVAPETEAQVYNAVKLDEIVDAIEAARREKEHKRSEKAKAKERAKEEAARAQSANLSSSFYQTAPPNFFPGAIHNMYPSIPMGFPMPIPQPFYHMPVMPVMPYPMHPQHGAPSFAPTRPRHGGQKPYQARPRQSKPQRPAPLPNKPATANIISAAPQIRDLQKELINFVPISVLRKKASSAQQKASSSISVGTEKEGKGEKG
ncbi:hypothetical protein BASA50_006559 [Batrachochytrium salamandrivorans]|uniref:Wbp11/ELF5/Saf1 N-terminal domain-containing protein n=1 Tax=Batrachochytrium salamandrivorans TaxID=1357716 RepID=A0ABQ8F9U0_9FUNG|nr:hypothetical protein BASA62_009201 [Batrachochytrium salamandrivorans]KAH6594610.1 hypothetical protein BASA50_006559 [Batrachochytrium salamandrivorans]KAH9252502.1 hypothetical protein BASA81_009545 [Batrachochytrium salamandrivorans]KAH9270940.1 hypothetical protein BASA83_006896 [Batrachochytrium salamandrivorans]